MTMGSERGFRWPRSRDQGRGESDCSHPDRKSKTSTPRGEARKKVQFHKPNYFGDGGEKNITVITAPRDQRRSGEGAGGGAGGSQEEDPNISSVTKVVMVSAQEEIS